MYCVSRSVANTGTEAPSLLLGGFCTAEKQKSFRTSGNADLRVRRRVSLFLPPKPCRGWGIVHQTSVRLPPVCTGIGRVYQRAFSWLSPEIITVGILA